MSYNSLNNLFTDIRGTLGVEDPPGYILWLLTITSHFIPSLIFLTDIIFFQTLIAFICDWRSLKMSSYLIVWISNFSSGWLRRYLQWSRCICDSSEFLSAHISHWRLSLKLEEKFALTGTIHILSLNKRIFSSLVIWRDCR